MHKPLVSLLLLASLCASASGCELAASFDRKKIPPEQTKTPTTHVKPPVHPVDAGHHDAGMQPSDGGPRDAGHDAGKPDMDATTDASIVGEAGVSDGGSDAGSHDAGHDGGPHDAGSHDAGHDAGSHDAGAHDAGM